MREIQRLLSMRVEQENRRLEAEGIDPVSEPGIGSEGPLGARTAGVALGANATSIRERA